MRKHLLLTAATLCWVATGAMAADNAAKTGSSAPAPAAQAENGDFNGKDKDWTLDEARKHAHERAEKAKAWADEVDKMSAKDWAEHEKKYHAFRDKMDKMTPEEKKAYWEKRKEWHEEKHAEKETGNNSQASDKK